MRISLSEIAKRVGGRIKGDQKKVIYNVAPFEHATDNDITFVDSTKLAQNISATKRATRSLRDLTKPIKNRPNKNPT